MRRLWRIRKILKNIILHSASLESFPSLYRIIEKTRPNEVYHLAAQSYVDYSFEDEYSTLRTNINGTHYMLSSVKEISKDIRFYFAASSEMFGKVSTSPQNEDTPFHPRSAYGISKMTGFELTRNYREAYDLHASSGILFNHESPRRGYEFVTRKISQAVARIKYKLQTKIKLGNLKSKRDWGYAKDYVEVMWLMLQQDKPDDYVVGTGESHSVEEFAKKAFEYINLNYKDFVVTDQNLFRPSEVDTLIADTRKSKSILKWKNSITFNDLIIMMVESDLKNIKDST